MNRPDFSDLVAHFTKEKQPCGARNHPTDSATQSACNLSAYQRLVSILENRRIHATFMPWTNKKAVAFTECPFWSLLGHAKQYSPYGVGFKKARLFAAGGGPAIYLRPNLHDRQTQHFVKEGDPETRGFDGDIYAFVTRFLPAYAPKEFKDKHGGDVTDYTHEREWRVPHDFVFQSKDVAFVVVRTYEDMAQFPKHIKDEIGREKFLIMDMYLQIEKLWPTHRIE